MSSVFLNKKGQYLVVTEHSTRAMPVQDYHWTDSIDNAQVFKNVSSAKQFNSTRHFLKWRVGSPISEIVGEAHVKVVRTVTITEMRGVQ